MSRFKYAAICLTLFFAVAVAANAQFNILEWWTVASSAANVGEAKYTVPVSVNGNQVWHPGNDGSGSGLDADLLDGAEGSTYEESAEIASSVSNHDALNAAHGTSGIASTSALTAHTGNTSNPHNVTFTQAGAEQAGSVASHDALTAVHGVAEVAGTEDIPLNASFTLGGLASKTFAELTDTPTTLGGYGITDGALDASLTAHVGDTGNPHSVTYAQAGAEPLGSVASHDALTAAHGCAQIASVDAITSAIASHDALTAAHGCSQIASVDAITSAIASHDALTAVHGVSQVADDASLTAHINNASNPHSVTYDQAGAEASGTVAAHAAVIETHGIPALADNAQKVLTVGTDSASLYWKAAAEGGTSDHAALANLGYSASGHTGFASTASLTDAIDDLSGVASAAEARTNLDVYSKTETDALAAQSTLRYYFAEEASDIGGYESFATAPVAVQASDAITLTTDLTLVDAWVTPANTPHLTTLVSGVYEVEAYVSKTGNGTAYTTMELWSRGAEGTETFVASSTTSTLTGVIASPMLVVLRFSVNEAVTLAATDRLVVKLYGYRGAVTSGLVLWYGGTTSAYFGVPISPRNFMRVDASNAELSAAQANLGITADIANLAAHVASTGTAVHGLGTMATEAKTDYTATGTFTSHTGDSSDPHGSTLTQTTIVSDSVDGVDVSAHVASAGVHGVAQVAGIEDVNDALSAANASDTLNLRLDGSRAMTGSLKFTGNYGILQSTIDGADTGSILGSGGGYTSGNLYDRGAAWILYGNEYATIGGQARYYAGNVSTGDHVFYAGAGTERFRIANNGNVGIGTTAPISRLDLGDGSTGKTISWGGPWGENNYANIWTAYANADLIMATGMIGSTTSDIYKQSYAGSWLARNAIRVTANGTDGIRFFTDPGDSTAKGATVTPSERMRINSAGNVLIGTTTDDGVNKLQVNGSVAISSFVQLASPTAIPTAAAGRIYFNGSEAKFKKCLNGSTWVDM